MAEAAVTAPPHAEIRRLTVADTEAYRRIRLSALATEPDYFGSTFEERAAQPIAVFADRLVSASVFAACTPERFVGVVHLSSGTGTKEAHKGMVQGFFVEPAWRRHGIGSALMTTVIEAARHNLEQLHLTVVAGNDAAFSLYQRFGFKTYGIEPRSLKTARGYSDEYLMVLLLS